MQDTIIFIKVIISIPSSNQFDIRYHDVLQFTYIYVRTLYWKIPNLGDLSERYFSIVARHHTRLDTVHSVRIVPRKKPSGTLLGPKP